MTRLAGALAGIISETLTSKESINKLLELIKLEEQNKRALGVKQDEIFKIEETKLKDLINILALDKELIAEILVDEQNYSNKALEIATNFVGNLKDVYLNYRKKTRNRS